MKTKRKNKALPLIILVVLLAALLIGYKALSAANDRKAAEEAASLASENADTMIAAYDYTTLTSLSYRAQGGDPITLTQSAGVFSYADDANFPLNQTIAAQMANAISQIAVETTVESGSEADYGLDNPAYLIEAAYADGTKHVYKIGNYNAFNGAYYFSMDGTMYMISSGLIPYFQYTEEDLLALDTIPASDWRDTSYIGEITVTNGDKSCTISDDAGKTEVIGAIGAFRLSDCADYYADADEKAAFGLDGSVSAAVKYKKAVTSTDESGNQSTSYLETTYTLLIGHAAQDGTGYYVSPQKSNIVYLVDEETVLALLAYAEYVPAPAEDALTEG
ncbi:MAG: DUF4340 domain-containing protein [Clostridia bacterium]|nr:DUF4340 domain-containing protein [Clostridia bacterium]